MQTLKLIGRSSRLSLLQIDIVKYKIQSAFPEIKVEVIERSSKGDDLKNIPLHTVVNGGTSKARYHGLLKLLLR